MTFGRMTAALALACLATVLSGPAALLFGFATPLFGLATPAHAEIDSGVPAALAEQSLPMPSVDGLIVCHGFGCTFRTPVALGTADHAKFAQFLAAGKASPAAERRAVALGFQWLQKRVAPETGTAGAKAHSTLWMRAKDQFDCIDSMVNTTQYVIILDRLGLLKHHIVDAPASRLPFRDYVPHTTAVLRERGSGKQWVVDPWTHKSGEVPDVMPLPNWYAGEEPASEQPSPPAGAKPKQKRPPKGAGA